MSVMIGSSKAVQNIVTALGLPKNMVSFTLRVVPDDIVLATVEMHVEDNGGSDKALESIFKNYALIEICEKDKTHD